jgi:hypothetical protein
VTIADAIDRGDREQAPRALHSRKMTMDTRIGAVVFLVKVAVTHFLGTDIEEQG